MPKAHYHKGIETIAYMLEGECTVYYGDDLQKHCWCARASSVSLPPTYRTRRATKAGNRAPGSWRIPPVAIRTASCCYQSLMQVWRRGPTRQHHEQKFCSSAVGPWGGASKRRLKSEIGICAYHCSGVPTLLTCERRRQQRPVPGEREGNPLKPFAQGRRARFGGWWNNGPS